MADPIASPIQILSVFLTGLNFKTLKSIPSDISIHTDNLSIKVSIEGKSNFVTISTVEFLINSTDAHRIDFEASLKYQIESRVEKEADVEALKAFAKIGAPFNALIHAREVVVGLTSRAFGKSVLIPLLDIRDFGSAISFVEPENPSNPTIP